MPKVKLPDGRAINFPEGTSPEEMSAAAESLMGQRPAVPQDKKPMLDEARRRGLAVDPSQGVSPMGEGMQGGAMSIMTGRAFDRAIAGVGEKALALGESVGVTSPEFLQNYRKVIHEDDAIFDALSKRHPKASFAGDVIGLGAATAPMNLLIPGSGITSMMARGAGTMAALPVDKNEDVGVGTLKQFGAGAATGLFGGLVVPPFVKAAVNAGKFGGRQLSNFGRWVGSKLSGKLPANQIVDDAGNFTALGNEVLVQMGFDPNMPSAMKRELARELKNNLKPVVVDALAKNRMTRAEQLGVGLTRGQATKRLQDQSFEQMVKGQDIGQPIRSLEESNNRALIEQLDNVKNMIGGTADDAYIAGERTLKNFSAYAKKTQENVGRVYDQIKESSGDIPVTASKIIEKIDDWDSSSTAKLVKNQLKKYYNKESETFEIPVSKLEEIRKRLNKIGQTAQSTDKHIVGELIEAIDDDVVESAGANVYGPARAKAQQRFAELAGKPDLPWAQKTLTQKIVGGYVKPDQFIRQFQSADPAEVAEMFRTLRKMPQGEQAIKDIAGSVWDYVKTESINEAPNVAGGLWFNVNKMGRMIDKLGERKANLIFPQEAMKLIKQIRAVGKDLQPNELALNRSGTAHMVVRWLDRLAGVMGKTGQVAKGMIRAGSEQAEKEAHKAKVLQHISPTDESIKAAQAEAQKNTVSLINSARAEAHKKGTEAMMRYFPSAQIGSAALGPKTKKLLGK